MPATQVLDPLGEALGSDDFANLLLAALQETARAAWLSMCPDTVHALTMMAL